MPKFYNIKLALAFLSLFALVSMVQDTYSKYNTAAQGDASLSIARWQISINNQDIIDNSYITNAITPSTISSDHVKEGVFAPQSVGYFDLVLDYSNVDTSFEYTIVTSIPESSGVTDLIVTGYSIDGGTIVPVSGGLTNITNTILLSEVKRTKTIRIYITWEDSLTETMDNEADTDATIAQAQAVLSVLINFKQVTAID